MTKKINKIDLINIWKKASEEQKQKIFYYSLFDFKSFEEDDARIELFHKTKIMQNKLHKIMMKINKRIFSKISKSNFVKFAGGDMLLKNLIIHELQKEKIKARSCGNHFPDILVEGNIHLEIKRQTTTKNMGDDVWGVNSKDCDKLLFLLFFPVLEDDDIERVKELTTGYYFLKKTLSSKREVEMIICFPTPSNFQEVLQKIIKCIKDPKWSKK